MGDVVALAIDPEGELRDHRIGDPVDQRPQVLVAMGALVEAEAPVVVPGLDRHVLEMALAAFVAGPGSRGGGWPSATR